MSERDAGGLTLEALAQRLETLERENTELRSKVATLEGSGTRRNEPAETTSLVPRCNEERVARFEGPVSRRALLSKAGAAAVAAVAAGTLLYPRQAKAHDLTAGITPNFVDTHWVRALNHADRTSAVEGFANTITGGAVYGVNSGTGPGVLGYNDALNSPDAAGVLGINSSGYGVKGEGKTGVWGLSSKAGFAANYGQNTNEGWGVVGDGKGTAFSGVMGRNPEGPGVEGRDSVYGGKFAGSRAQLMLVPKATAGKPTGAHAKGEISMDSAGTLFVCVKGGNPAKWKKLSATAV
jgi:hypothetical protein